MSKLPPREQGGADAYAGATSPFWLRFPIQYNLVGQADRIRKGYRPRQIFGSSNSSEFRGANFYDAIPKWIGAALHYMDIAVVHKTIN